MLQPLPPPPNATRVAPGDNLAPVAPTASLDRATARRYHHSAGRAKETVPR